MPARHWLLGLACAFALAGQRLEAADSDPLRVVTTTTDLAAIAAAVGGDDVEVESIARGYQDPHYVEAKPSFMRRLNRADLLIYNGLELEIGWLPLLVEGSRNRAVLPGRPGSLDASQGLAIIEVPSGQVDRSMGDIHPEGNPHYTLDPRSGIAIAERIAARLGQLAPDRAERFAARLDSFHSSLEARIAVWERRLEPHRNAQIVAHHKQWEYLASWLGLDIVGYVEEKPGVPPAPRHVAQIVARLQSLECPLVIHADFVDPRPCQRIAGRAGAIALSLPAAVGGEADVVDYADLFEAITTKLERALSHSGGPRDD